MNNQTTTANNFTTITWGYTPPKPTRQQILERLLTEKLITFEEMWTLLHGDTTPVVQPQQWDFTPDTPQWPPYGPIWTGGPSISTAGNSPITPTFTNDNSSGPIHHTFRGGTVDPQHPTSQGKPESLHKE